MLVLIGEDEPLTGLSMADELRAMGHAVLGPYFTAEGAVLAARRHKPDLAIMDIFLTGVRDGVWASAELAGLGVPTILTSGASDKGLAAHDHAVGFLPKPASRQALTEALEAILLIRAGGKPRDRYRGGFQLFTTTLPQRGAPTPLDAPDASDPRADDPGPSGRAAEGERGSAG